jgi:hypothetical protein
LTSNGPKRLHAFLDNLDRAVKEHFSFTIESGEFLAGTTETTIDQGRLIVQQVLMLIEQSQAHLPFKRAMQWWRYPL